MQAIGRYQIQGELGRGGMARVYRAWDPNFERTVAIKVLPREWLDDQTFRARFAQEARTIAALEHPAIVPVYDYGEFDGQPYLVMRLMPGGSLLDRLQTGPLPVDETVRILGQLAAALDRAHAQGFVHRDLKPGNILFDGDHNAYISDFGLARLVTVDTGLTSASVLGTPAYMAPEQAKGQRDLGPKADLYAFAAMAYQMLTGRLPYEAETPLALALKHVSDPPPKLRRTRPDLPAGAEAVITRAMAKAPRDRFATAGDFQAALTAALDPYLHPPAGLNPPGPTLPFPRLSELGGPHRTRWVLAAMAVLAGGLVLTLAATVIVPAILRSSTPTVVAVDKPSLEPAPPGGGAAPTPTPRPTRTQRPTATPRATATPTSPPSTHVRDFTVGSTTILPTELTESPLFFATGRWLRADVIEYLAAFDLETGDNVWRVPFAPPGGSPARIALGPAGLALYQGREVVLYDRETGAERWRATVSDVAPTCSSRSCVYVGAQTVVVLTGDGRLQGFDSATGAGRWDVAVRRPSQGMSAVAGRLVVFDVDEEDARVLQVVDPASGQVTVVAVICPTRIIDASPGNETVLVPTPEGDGVYVLFGLSGTVNCLTRLDWAALDAPPEPVQWESEAFIGDYSLRVSAGQVLAGDTYGVAIADPAITSARVIVTGDDENAYQAVSIGADYLIVAHSELRGSASTTLERLNLADGGVEWTFDLGPGRPIGLVASADQVDGDLGFVARPLSDGAIGVLGFRRQLSGDGPLVAWRVDAVTGAAELLLDEIIDGASDSYSDPDDFIWRGDAVWFVSGNRLWRFDFSSGEFGSPGDR